VKIIRALGVLVAGATGMVCSIAAAQPVPPTTVDNVVILANAEITFRRNSILGSGQALVNAPGGAARLDQGFRALDATLIVADTVDSLSPSGNTPPPPQLDDVVANTISPRVTVNGSAAGATFPVFDVFPAAPAVAPGGTDVRVRRGNSPVFLDAGDYGTIKVGHDGVVYFTGGTYNVREIRAGKRASLWFQNPATVNVSGRFAVGTLARFGPVYDGSARCIVVNIAPTASIVGTISRNGKIFATVNAPGSILRLGASGEFSGQFIGDTVLVGWFATVWADTPCP